MSSVASSGASLEGSISISSNQKNLSEQDFAAYEAKVYEAFASIDPSERQEYQEALETVPELVAEETQLRGLLLVEDLDPLRTAVHICQYWKCRKIIFQERWLLPLNVTGTGALDWQDLQFLRSGFYVIFKRGPTQGPFVLLDESRLPGPAGDANFRIIFYFDYLFRHEPPDITVLHVVNSRNRPPADMRRDLYGRTYQAIRWRIQHFFVAQAYEGEGRTELIEFLGYKTARTHEFRTQVPVLRLMAPSQGGMVRLLQETGFTRSQLPFCLGGEYDYAQFADWLRMRTSVEDVMSGAPAVLNRLSIPSRALVVGAGPLDAPVQRKRRGTKRPAPLSLTNGESTTTQSASSNNNETEALSAAELTRRRNALYSRRSNKRRDMALLSLQDQERILTGRNAALRVDNARLEHLLQAAWSVLNQAAATPPTPPATMPYMYNSQGCTYWPTTAPSPSPTHFSL